MSVELKVAGHYGKEGLEERVLQAVAHLGKDPATLTPADLAAMDEFHIGGLMATQELARQMELQPGLRMLDVGSGVGGPARYFAAEHACHVTGVDLTAEFVSAANSLTKLLKLDHLAAFRQANATALPMEAGLFDRAYMMHVGMNIADKLSVFREVRRVLKPGGLFVVFDIMRLADGKLRYPLPWAQSEETSFVATPNDYKQWLTEAGFHVERERKRREFGIEVTEKSMQQLAKHGPPVLGLQLLMGDATQLMVTNILGLMKEGLLGPAELFARVRT